MITKEQITEILNRYAGYMDRSRTEQAVHEDNFNDIADEILSKLSQHDVSGAVCLHESQYRTFNYDSNIERCDKCGEITN
jgi:hypothetical protein